MEIKTSHQIFKILNIGTMDKSFVDKKWVAVDGLIKRIDEIAGKGAKPEDKFEEGWERGLFELKDEIVECQK